MSKTSSRVKNRYNRKAYDRLTIIVPKGEKEKIKERAETEGLSLNGYVKAAIEEKMAREDLSNMTVLQIEAVLPKTHVGDVRVGNKNGTCSRCRHFSVEQFTFPTPFCKLRCRVVAKFLCCDYFEPEEV